MTYQDAKKALLENYKHTRTQTEHLCKPLHCEDYMLQAMEDVSPPKWHLAHTTWFFETFILIKQLPTYKKFDPVFSYLFNSYYQGIGKPYHRPSRGLISRPRLETVYAYRKHIKSCF